LLLASAAPCSAAEFYLVRDLSTPRCEIVEKRPPATEPVIIVGGFATRAQAENALASSALCRSL
jgi:hypothetical protein